MPLAILALLAAGVLLAGCGSDDDQGATPAPTPQGAAPPGNRVAMDDLKFHPRDITVKVGETITWVNEENVPHNVVNVEDGQQPKSELFNKGGTYEFTPQEPGRIAYVCTIHPGMEGSITVE